MKKLAQITALIISLTLTGCSMAPITVVNVTHGKIIKEYVTTKKQSSGIATLGGAALGGYLGSKVGGGSGKKVATVLGAIGGGVIGNAATSKTVRQYAYIFKMKTGPERSWNARGERYLVGQKVVIEQLSNGRDRVSIIR